MRSFCALVLFASAVFAQTAPASGGVESEWDLRKMLDALVAGTRKLKPVVDQVNPQNWQNAQAAQDYAPLWKSAQNEIQYLGVTTASLAKEPERLTLALETYFRMQSLDAMLSSLGEGIRKYQNPALADLLRGVATDSAAGREKLRQYVVQLAAYREEQFSILDQEAQRCRTRLLQQPPQRNQGASK